jgi:predicted RNA-binding Zn ribbon-like protein
VSTLSDKKCEDEALELVRSFVNTLEIDGDERTEAVGDPGALAAWIREHAGVPVKRLGRDDHRRALELRESLRALLLTHNGVGVESRELEPLRRAGAEAKLAVRLDRAGDVELAPASDGLRAFEEKILLAIAEAQALGTWRRLKACRAEDCHWAFYDSSRNRSGAWCTMETCGNRAKTRRYRRRRKGG